MLPDVEAWARLAPSAVDDASSVTLAFRRWGGEVQSVIGVLVTPTTMWAASAPSSMPARASDAALGAAVRSAAGAIALTSPHAAPGRAWAPRFMKARLLHVGAHAPSWLDAHRACDEDSLSVRAAPASTGPFADGGATCARTVLQQLRLALGCEQPKPERARLALCCMSDKQAVQTLARLMGGEARADGTQVFLGGSRLRLQRADGRWLCCGDGVSESRSHAGLALLACAVHQPQERGFWTSVLLDNSDEEVRGGALVSPAGHPALGAGAEAWVCGDALCLAVSWEGFEWSSPQHARRIVFEWCGAASAPPTTQRCGAARLRVDGSLAWASPKAAQLGEAPALWAALRSHGELRVKHGLCGTWTPGVGVGSVQMEILGQGGTLVLQL